MAFLAVFVPLTTLQYFACRENYHIWCRLEGRSRESVAQSAATAVDETLQQVTSQLYDTHRQMQMLGNSTPTQSILKSYVERNSQCIEAGIIDVRTGKVISYPQSGVITGRDAIPPPNRWVVGVVTPVRKVGDRSVFTVGLPTETAGGTPAMMYAVLSTEVASKALERFKKEPMHTVVIDQNGEVVTETAQGLDSKLLKRLVNGKKTEQNSTTNLDTSQADCSIVTAPLSRWKVAVMAPDVTEPSPIGGVQWIIWSVISGAAAAVFTLKLGGRIANPVRKLSRAAKAVAVGDLRRRVEIKSGDELQVLAECFNQMADSLEEHENELRLNARVQQCLLDVTRTVHGSLDLEDVTAAISDALTEQFGAKHVCVFRIDEISGTLKQMCTDKNDTVSEATMSMVEQALSSPGSLSTHSSVAYPGHEADGDAVIAIPLNAGNKRVGVLAATFHVDENVAGLKTLMDILETFATYAAVAVHNAYIHSRTEELTLTLASLRQVEEAISSSLDLNEVMRALVRTTADVMGAKGCAILLADRHGMLNIAESYNLSEEFRDELSVRSGEGWTGIAFAEKRPITRTDLADDDIKRSEMVRKEGIRGFISAPLVAGSEAIGVINVWMDRPYNAKPTEIYLLTSIASHAAAVIANAKLFGREYQIAETLQNSLMANVPDQIGRLRFGHKYLPALDEARVGGDIYDVVPLSNGKIYVMVADVAGKGIGAAVHIATIRYMGRAFAFDHPDSPGATLTKLNQALISCSTNSTMVTLFCALIDPATGEMLYANAGHPPGILITRSGKQQIWLYRTGMPIGYSEDCTYDERCVKLEENDTLLLYTDGITEAKRGNELFSTDGLQDLLFKHKTTDPSELVELICEEAHRFTEGDLRDDVAVIAVTFLTESECVQTEPREEAIDLG